MTAPSSESVEAWKRAYGAVYELGMRGKSYVIRPLTVGEYQTVQNAQLSSAELEEFVVGVALLHPEDFDVNKEYAGVVTALAEEVLHVSGFTDPRRAKEILDEKRLHIRDIYNLMIALVVAAMPSYREADLYQLTFAGLAEKVALAEKILEIQLNISTGSAVTIELVDPEEEAQKQAAAKRKFDKKKKVGEADYDDPIASRLRAAMG